MKKILLALALCSFSALATAATVTVNWTNPTTNTDGSTIPATGPGSLTNARIEYGTCNGTAFGVKAGEVTRAQPATTTTVNLQPGTSCVRVFVGNTYGSESASSNVASKVVDAPIPSPPTNLTVSSPTVYDVRPNYEKFAFDRGMVVGTVKVGLACDEERKALDPDPAKDFYALERPSKVVLTKVPRSTALVAACS